MKTIVVTGANKGIGKETVRQLAAAGHQTILTGRDSAKIQAAQAELKKDGVQTDIHVLDVADGKSVKALVDYVTEKYGKLDVLINNAGVFLDKTGSDKAEPEVIRQTFTTNVLGPFTLIQAFTPLLKKAGNGRIINLSSGMGGLTEMGGGYPAYRISKAAVNAVTRIFSNDLAADKISVNSVCPGHVKTDMGGAGASREVDKGAETVVWLATADKIPNGKFLRDKKEIPW